MKPEAVLILPREMLAWPSSVVPIRVTALASPFIEAVGGPPVLGRRAADADV